MVVDNIHSEPSTREDITTLLGYQLAAFILYKANESMF
jgi:hypothetical protein